MTNCVAYNSIIVVVKIMKNNIFVAERILPNLVNLVRVKIFVYFINNLHF